MEQGVVEKGVFAFKLAANGSELYLGGTNDELYKGDFEYHPVDTSTGFWQITDAEVSLDGVTIVSDFETIIDSGSTIMYGPPEDVKKFYDAIPGSGVFDADYGYYYFPCNSVPTVAFSWGGKQWNISETKYVFSFVVVGRT